MIHAMKLQFSAKQLVRDLEDLKGEMYSFAQLSKLSGVDQRYISSWVQGDADYIRFQHVEKFLDYLHREGVDVSKGCTLTVTNEPEPTTTNPPKPDWIQYRISHAILLGVRAFEDGILCVSPRIRFAIC